MNVQKEFEAKVVGYCIVGGFITMIFAVGGVIGLMMLGAVIGAVYALCKSFKNGQGHDPGVKVPKDASVV